MSNYFPQSKKKNKAAQCNRKSDQEKASDDQRGRLDFFTHVFGL